MDIVPAFSYLNTLAPHFLILRRCGIVEIEAADSMEIDTRTDLVLAECLIAHGTRSTAMAAVCTNLL